MVTLPPLAPQTPQTFETFIKYKNPGLYDRTLHSTYAQKKGQTFKCTKVAGAPQPRHAPPLPAPLLPAPRGVWGGAGAPSPTGGHRAPALHGPGLSCPQPSCPRPGGGKPEKGVIPMAPKLPVGHLLLAGAVGQPLPTPPQPLLRGAGGVQMSPIPPQSWGEGRCRQGLHTRTQRLPLGRGDGIRPPPPSPGETEAQRGAFANQRSLCLAEQRQGPALSTRLKQRKTASHVCVPNSTGSTQLGQHRPACSGGAWLLPPLATAAAAPALAKGEACTPLLAAPVATPPALPEQRDLTLPTTGRGLLARAGAVPSLCAGAACGAAGLVHRHSEYGAGVLQTHSWGRRGQRNPGG